MVAAMHSEAASVPVCRGSSKSFAGVEKHRIADFVHGQDGFGNKRPQKSKVRMQARGQRGVAAFQHLHFPLCHLGVRSYAQMLNDCRRCMQASASSESAVEFMVRVINDSPGEITILALAACTNVALALQQDPELHTKWKELVILGGAFHINGNVNPAAEANILGDAEAADYVFARGTNTYVVGLDVTMDCVLTKEELESLQGEFSRAAQHWHAAQPSVVLLSEKAVLKTSQVRGAVLPSCLCSACCHLCMHASSAPICLGRFSSQARRYPFVAVNAAAAHPSWYCSL
jgi:inosine-uridine nucleoside N-ribohydrolase